MDVPAGVTQEEGNTGFSVHLLPNRRYFQHAHFIPIVGVGKRGEY